MEQLARELEEKLKQELERLREEEEMKKKSRRGKRELGKEKDNASGKKSQHGGRQVGGCVYREEKSPEDPPVELYHPTGSQQHTCCARGQVPGWGNMGLGWETTLVDHTASPPGCSDPPPRSSPSHSTGVSALKCSLLFPLSSCPEFEHLHQQHQRVHQQPLGHQRRGRQEGVCEGAPGLRCR